MNQELNSDLKSPLAMVVFDIDGVLRDVCGSYRRAIADTVEHFTEGAYRPSLLDIDKLKGEGIWNNDWEASQELINRYFEQQGQGRSQLNLNYDIMVSFFQSRYRGTDPDNWNGYICNEPLLVHPTYLEQLNAAGIFWGFFSGATRGSATYVLEKRLGLKSPVLIAMEDAPGKPDPTGLLKVVHQLEQQHSFPPLAPVIYVGDTVGDIYTLEKAKQIQPERTWIAIGIQPPHVQETLPRSAAYTAMLQEAGAVVVFSNVQQLTPAQISNFLSEQKR